MWKIWVCTVPSLAAALTGCKVKGASSDHHAEGVAFAVELQGMLIKWWPQLPTTTTVHIEHVTAERCDWASTVRRVALWEWRNHPSDSHVWSYPLQLIIVAIAVTTNYSIVPYDINTMKQHQIGTNTIPVVCDKYNTNQHCDSVPMLVVVMLSLTMHQ